MKNIQRHTIDEYRANPELLLRADGRLQGLYFQRGTGRSGNTPALLVQLPAARGYTKFGIARLGFDQQYSRAIDKLLHCIGVKITPELRARFEDTKHAFLAHHGIRVVMMPVLVFD